MPYSFTNIEEDKSKVIGFIFLFLVLFYFLSAVIIYMASKIYFFFEAYRYEHYLSPFSAHLSLQELFRIICTAFVIGAGHWLFSTNNLIPRLMNVLQAEPLNPKDTYHQMLQNIIDEVSVATGGSKIEGVVLPTVAMNAFALADFEGRAVIGVTEGLLARLSRAQIEAVVGHEAAHIVSGDCLATTVTTSLFRLYSSTLSGMTAVVGEGRTYRSRGGGYIVLIYLLLSVINFIGTLLNMFISRQREFRADSIAVRLTRDPLSLSEALYTISRRWHGSGSPGEELEAIFIVNPNFQEIDEQEGFLSDLLSTHPPLKKRLDILLDMAHSNLKTLEDELKNKSLKPKQTIPDVGSVPLKEWLANKDGEWVGPYTLQQLSTFDWFRPDGWIKPLGAEHITRAYDDSELAGLFNQGQLKTARALMCPKCQMPLTEINYEGVPISKCSSCQGVFVHENDIHRIIIREDVGFSDDIRTLAKKTKEDQHAVLRRKLDLKTVQLCLYVCPGCQDSRNRMIRTFYSYEYTIEIDRCYHCGSVWFDKNELEILQFLQPL